MGRNVTLDPDITTNGYEHLDMNYDSSGISCTNRREYLQGFAAALSVLITGASQSRQHATVDPFPGISLILIESHHRFFPVVTSLFDVGSSMISIFIVNDITRMFWQNYKDNA
ncbi:hypothetical protein Tco_0737077 [Tanacetum coccineum]